MAVQKEIKGNFKPIKQIFITKQSTSRKSVRIVNSY